MVCSYTLRIFISEEHTLDFSIVDILSIGASISTIIGLVVAILSLWNYYHEKRKEKKYEIKRYFYDGRRWDCIDYDEELENFTLIINNAPFFRMAGEIEYSKTKDTEVFNIENMLYFDLKKSNTKEITIEIYRYKEISDIDLSKIILGTATLKYMTPHQFVITFSQGCLPNFPRTTTIETNEYYIKLFREQRIEADTKETLS